MAGLTDSIVFSIRCGSQEMTADLHLSIDEQWSERTQPLRDSVGPTSAFVWMASRRRLTTPICWEVEWEICAGACDPANPEAVATTLCVDSVVLALPNIAPHVCHQNPRSTDRDLVGQCVIPVRGGICGRLALGPRDHHDMLQQMAYGLPEPVHVRAAVAHFGPSGWSLPEYDPAQQSSKWEGKFTALLATLAAGGEYSGEDWGDGIRAEALACGWKRPYLEFNSYAYGGSGIEFLSGYQGIWHARYALLSHMLVAQRCRFAYNSAREMQPLSVDDYGAESPNYNWVDLELPEFQNVRVIGTPVEPLYTSSHAFKDPDPQHDIRAQRKAIEGWEYFASPLCARHICARAEDRRLIYSEKGPPPHAGYVPYNLRNLLTSVSQHPNQGCSIGRDFGWTLHIVAMFFKVRQRAVSRGWKGWVQKAIQLLNTAAMPTGLIQRGHEPPKTGPATEDSAQSFEVVILAWGAHCAATQSGLALGDWILKSATELYRELQQREAAWAPNAVGPYHYVFVAAHGGRPYQEILLGVGSDPTVAPGDAAYKAIMCMLAFRVSKDVTWFDTAATALSTDLTRDQYISECHSMMANAEDGESVKDAPIVLSEWQRATRLKIV